MDAVMNVLVPLIARNFLMAGHLVGFQAGHGSMKYIN